MQNKNTQSADVLNPLTALENELDNAAALIAEGNFPQAELHLGLYAQAGGQHSRAADLFV